MSKYFKPQETACRCGCGTDLTDEIKQKLDAFREAMGFALSLTSGARCPAHNEAEDGAPDSYHVKRRAGDIDWTKYDGAKKAKMLAYAIQNFGGIGLHKSFLHVDDRALKTVWFY